MVLYNCCVWLTLFSLLACWRAAGTMGWFKREDPLVSASAADLETASNEQGESKLLARP